MFLYKSCQYIWHIKLFEKGTRERDSWILCTFVNKNNIFAKSRLYYIQCVSNFHSVSRHQLGKYVENTFAAFRIKGVAVFALHLLSQPLGSLVFPIVVLVVFLLCTGRPEIPWNSYTCLHVKNNVYTAKTEGEKYRRFASTIVLSGNPRCSIAMFIKYRHRISCHYIRV